MPSLNLFVKVWREVFRAIKKIIVKIFVHKEGEVMPLLEVLWMDFLLVILCERH